VEVSVAGRWEKLKGAIWRKGIRGLKVERNGAIFHLFAIREEPLLLAPQCIADSFDFSSVKQSQPLPFGLIALSQASNSLYVRVECSSFKPEPSYGVKFGPTLAPIRDSEVDVSLGKI